MLWIEVAAAALFLLLIVRVAYLLTANPIGELTPELLYLRAGDLRAPAFFGFLLLILEVVEFAQPAVSSAFRLPPATDFPFYVNALQALLLLVILLLAFIVAQRYTHRGLDRRMRESIENLAYLAGQRRRRARGRGGAERGEDADDAPRGRFE